MLGRSRQRLTIGISDHVTGPEPPALVARKNAQDPQLLIEIRIGSSGDLLQSFDRRELDTVIVRLHAGRSDGVLLTEEPFGWFAATDWQPLPGEPLPLHSRVRDGRPRGALDALSAALRSAVRG